MAGATKHLSEYKGKKKKYFDLLMQARALVQNQYDFHSDEALKQNDSDPERKGMGTHLGDIGDSNLRDMELQLMSDEGNVLGLIEEALGRLANNDYGNCVDCGDDIPEARLEIKPYALFCIKCKQIREENDGINPYID